jgi:major vault protein
MELQVETAKKKGELDLIVLETNARTEAETLAKKLEAEKSRAEIAVVTRHETEVDRELQIALDAKAQEVKINLIRAEVQALVDKAHAVSPDLVAALQAFSERHMLEKVAASMAPLSIMGGTSVVDVLKKLLEGTALAKQLDTVAPAVAAAVSGNGKTSAKTLQGLRRVSAQ